MRAQWEEGWGEMGWSGRVLECQEGVSHSHPLLQSLKDAQHFTLSGLGRNLLELKIKGLHGLNRQGPPFLGLPRQALVTGISCFRWLPGAGRWGWGAGFYLFVGSALASDSPAPRTLHPFPSQHPQGTFITAVPRKRVMNWSTHSFLCLVQGVMLRPASREVSGC